MDDTVPASAEEIWVPLPGMEGRYEVSDQGRVRSVARSIVRANGRRQDFRVRVLKQAIDSSGYRMVGLVAEQGGRPIPRQVHRLVLRAFAGEPPEGQVACHGPGGKLDNRLSNLYWGTRSRNNGADRHRDGVMTQAKLSEEEVLRIRADSRPQAVIAREYGVSQSTVCDIKSGRLWAHLGEGRPVPPRRKKRKLSLQQVLEIRRDGRPHREIAASYGASPSAVSMIKSGKRWGGGGASVR